MHPSRKPSLGAIFLTVFLDLLGFGLVLPFLAEEARDTFHSTAFVATLLSAVYSLMQFLFVPLWGRLSDRVGRRPVLIWSIFGTAIANAGLGAALAWGAGIHWLFAARVFAGIATANLGTATAYIADVTAPKDRAKGMGLIGMAFGLGFILGPGIGGVLASISINGRHGPWACFAAAALSLVNFAWVLFGLVESLPPERRAHSIVVEKTPGGPYRGADVPRRRLSPLDFSALRRALSDVAIGRAIAVNFVLVISFANLDQTYRFFNKDMFAMSTRETGLVLGAIGVTAALVQGLIVRRLSGKVEDAQILRVGVFIQIIAFALTALSPSIGIWMLYVSGILLAIGNGLSQPSVSAYVSKCASADAQGTTLGASQSVASLARVFGPALGGWLYGSVGERAPYWTAAGGMVIALVLALRLPQRDAA
ncbi:tetracycline resistance MFS efflux pump [soil metagenome]